MTCSGTTQGRSCQIQALQASRGGRQFTELARNTPPPPDPAVAPKDFGACEETGRTRHPIQISCSHLSRGGHAPKGLGDEAPGSR